MPLDLRINGRPVDHTEARRLLETTTVEDPMPPVTTADEPTTTVGVLAEAGALRESPEPGRVRLRIIEAGQGSSGMYPEDTLREAAVNRVFRAGETLTFIDHPTASEGYERPERSVRDLAGRLAEDARFEDGALVAEAEVFPHWRPVIEAMADVIGVSIRADGRIDESGTVREISRARSVDYVTEAGAGGRIEALVESARHDDLAEARNVADWIEVEIHRGVMGLVNSMWGEGGSLSREEWGIVNDATADAMTTFRNRIAQDAPDLLTRDPAEQPNGGMFTGTDSVPTNEATSGAGSGDTNAPQGPNIKEAAMSASTAPADGATTTEPTDTTPVEEAAQEQSVTALRNELTEMQRQLAERDALDRVRTIVREATDLPEAARERAVKAVDLNADDLAEATKQALDAERTYVAEVLSSRGVGRVTGMGEATKPADENDLREANAEKVKTLFS